MSALEPFPFPDLVNLSPDLQQQIAKRRGLNVYRMLMHTPEVAPAYMAMADALLRHSSLSDSVKELVIIRVTHRYGAFYGTYQHEKLARAVGLSDGAIAAAKDAGSPDVYTEDQRLVVALVDEILDSHRLTADSRRRAMAGLSAVQLADLVFTVGFYQLVSNFLSVFAVPLEA